MIVSVESDPGPLSQSLQLTDREDLGAGQCTNDNRAEPVDTPSTWGFAGLATRRTTRSEASKRVAHVAAELGMA